MRDVNQMFLAAIEREDGGGVFNATGPNPVENAEFMREGASPYAVRRVLAWAVYIAAVSQSLYRKTLSK